MRRPDDVGFDGVRQPRLDGRGPDRRHSREGEARRLLRRPHRHGAAAAASLAREDRRHRPLRRTRRRRAARPRRSSKRSSATCRPTTEWEHLVFGRGSADQLRGVVSQIIATKILLELAPRARCAARSCARYATVAEEDNDGGGPQYLVRKVLPGRRAGARSRTS